MKHELAEDVSVYKSYKYEAFKKMEGNRTLNKKKIKRICDDIRDGLDILKHAPVIVDEDMQIVDGQHRFEVSMIMKRPVYYVIAEDMTIREVASINSRTEKWKPSDFLKSYCKLNLQDYKDLREFLEAYPFTIMMGAALLQHGEFKQGGSSTVKDDFQDGQFKVQYYEKAYELAETCNLFTGVIKGNFSRGFGTAIQILLEKDIVAWDTLVNKAKSQSFPPEAHNNYKENLAMLEMIYNKGNHDRRAIY